jgi:hypothetical protein
VHLSIYLSITLEEARSACVLLPLVPPHVLRRSRSWLTLMFDVAAACWCDQSLTESVLVMALESTVYSTVSSILVVSRCGEEKGAYTFFFLL